MKNNLVLLYAALMFIFSFNTAQAEATLIYFNKGTRITLPKDNAEEIYSHLKKITTEMDFFGDKRIIISPKSFRKVQKNKTGIEFVFSSPESMPFGARTKAGKGKGKMDVIWFALFFHQKDECKDKASAESGTGGKKVCSKYDKKSATFGFMRESTTVFFYFNDKLGHYVDQIEKLVEKQMN